MMAVKMEVPPVVEETVEDLVVEADAAQGVALKKRKIKERRGTEGMQLTMRAGLYVSGGKLGDWESGGEGEG